MSRPSGSLALIAILSAVLSACAGAPTRFYTLDAMAPSGSAVAAYAGPPVRIDAVHIPPAFDRLELVRETSTNRFTVSDNDHWAAPLDELLRRVITQDLAARLPDGVVIFPDTPKPSGASGVVIDILALSPSAAGVVMDVSWTVSTSHAAGASAPLQALDRQTSRLSVPVSGGGVGGDAAEISGLADQLAAAIAEDLARRGR